MTEKEYKHRLIGEREQNTKAVENFIIKYINAHTYSPSAREISDGVGLHIQTVRAKMRELLEAGFIETDLDEFEGRSYRISGTKVVRRKKYGQN